MRKQKSLRQLARELGVSHSYLSQVQHGKRPASEKVEKALDMVSMVSNTEAKTGTFNPLVTGSNPVRPTNYSHGQTDSKPHIKSFDF
jgi:transcriptional regulator with XRE-family HTH domain